MGGSRGQVARRAVHPGSGCSAVRATVRTAAGAIGGVPDGVRYRSRPLPAARRAKEQRSTIAPPRDAAAHPRRRRCSVRSGLGDGEAGPGWRSESRIRVIVLCEGFDYEERGRAPIHQAGGVAAELPRGYRRATHGAVAELTYRDWRRGALVLALAPAPAGQACGEMVGRLPNDLPGEPAGLPTCCGRHEVDHGAGECPCVALLDPSCQWQFAGHLLPCLPAVHANPTRRCYTFPLFSSSLFPPHFTPPYQRERWRTPHSSPATSPVAPALLALLRCTRSPVAFCEWKYIDILVLDRYR